MGAGKNAAALFDYNSWSCSFDDTSNWDRSFRARFESAGNGNLVVHSGRMQDDMGSCSWLNSSVVDKSVRGKNCLGTSLGKLERCMERQVQRLAVGLMLKRQLVDEMLKNRRVGDEAQFLLGFVKFQPLMI